MTPLQVKSQHGLILQGTRECELYLQGLFYLEANELGFHTPALVDHCLQATQEAPAVLNTSG